MQVLINKLKAAVIWMVLGLGVQFAAAQSRGVWISPEEIAQLPTSGASWDQVKQAADSSLSDTPCLSARTYEGIQVIAKALVYVRTGQDSYRQQVINALQAVIGTENTYNDPLAVARKAGTYAIAADIIGYRDPSFMSYMGSLLHKQMGPWAGLVDIDESRPNNWGMHAGASRVAISGYLGDDADVARAAQVFKGWVGDRSSYSSFSYGALDWQYDSSKPVGINPKGATKNGHSIDGVLPDDERRSGGFTWPPPKENYVYEALQGALVEATLLNRAGYDVWNWQDQALLRAYQWLHVECNFAATGDDTFEDPLVDYAYGTHYWDGSPTNHGKNMGFTDWTHAKNSGSVTPPPPPPVVSTYTLQTSVSGAGSVTVSPNGGSYADGTVVTLTAVPSQGYQFTGWSGNLSGSSNPATITMNGDKSVTANFAVVAPSTYTLSVSTMGLGSVALNPPGGQYASGTVVTLTATADSGYEFTGWNGDASGTSNPVTVVMNSQKSVIAHFSSTGGNLVETASGGSTGSNTVRTSGAVTGVSGQLYLAAISTKPWVETTRVTGMGLTWVPVGSQCAGRSQTGVSVWAAQGSASGDGAVTATLASAPVSAVIQVTRYANVDGTNAIASVSSANTNGIGGACSGGTDSDAYNYAPELSSTGSIMYVAAAERNRTHTPGFNYIERAEVSSGNGGGTAGLAIEDKSINAPASTTVDGSFSAKTDWAVVSVELSTQSQAPQTPPPSISSFSPEQGQVGTAVTIVGSNFTGTSSVTFNGTPATFTVTNDGQISTTAPAGAATGPITVTTPNGAVTSYASFTVVVPQPPPSSSTTPAFEEAQTGASSGSKTVATSSNLQAVAGNLYLAAVATRNDVPVVSLTGLGLNWSRVKAQSGGRGQDAVEVWMAQGTPNVSGAVTATLASAADFSTIAVARYSGVSPTAPIGNVVSANTNGFNGASSGGTDQSSYDFNLSPTDSNSLVVSAVTMRMRSHTPGDEFSQRAEIYSGSGGGTASVGVQDRTTADLQSVPVYGSFSSNVDWAAVAVEIRP